MRHFKGGTRGKHAARFALAAILSATLVAVSTVPAWAYHYSDVVLSDLPLAYWDMDSRSTDLAGTANLSVCTGSYTYSAHPFVAGTTNSIVGNGSSYCKTSSLGLTGSNYSLEVWTHRGGAGSGVVLMADASNASFGLAFDGNAIRVDHTIGGVAQVANDCADDGADHYYVATRAGDTVKLYQDATLCLTLTGASTNAPGGWCKAAVGGHTDFGCGTNFGTAIPSGSYVGQAAIYNFALTGAQISAHYAARTAPPAATLAVTPQYAAVRAGHTILYTFSSTDSTGAPASGSPYTLTSSSPSGACSSLTTGGGGLLCTASTTTGVYTLHWQDTLGNTAVSELDVVGLAASFVVLPHSCNTTLDSACNFQAFAYSAAGVDITSTDPWGPDTLPTHVTCVGTSAPGTSVHIENCYANATGTYTIPFSDAQGLSYSVTMTVGVANNQQSCGATDVGCWISNLVGAVTKLGSDIVTGIYNLFFLSANGPSYIDFSPLTANIFPNGTCRSGQTPTAADGVHCLSFPFSIPADVGGFVDLINATPTAPTLTLAWDFHLWTGTTLHETGTIDPRVVLTDTTMSYVRDIELVLFIIGTAFGTWRLLQLVGVD